MTETAGRGRAIAVPAVIAAAILAIWFTPPPQGLTVQAWRLFAIFAGAIVFVVANALPILTASVFAVAAAVLTGLLPPAKAYAGFANGTILLIVLAFLVARSVVKCGLGARIGHLLVSRFGRSTLGLSYSIFLVDGAHRAGVSEQHRAIRRHFPARVFAGRRGRREARRRSRQRLGSFLMFSGIVSLSLSSALWLTAMAANPMGAEIAKRFGVEMGFGSWLLAASVPTLVAMVLMPLVLYRIIAPELTSTPEAPAAARRALVEIGPLKRDEKVVVVAFAGMVSLWASAASLGLDSTAVAFLGLGALLASGVLTLEDIRHEGDVLATFIWFAVLFTLSSQLNELGFMGFLGQRLADAMGGLAPAVAGVVLLVAYVALHYVFVSQTAHLLALFGVFLDVGVKLGVPPAPLAFQLLFATNYFAAITPQGSSANLLFAGSGFLSQRDLYRLGALSTACTMLIYVVIGTPWLRLVL